MKSKVIAVLLTFMSLNLFAADSKIICEKAGEEMDSVRIEKINAAIAREEKLGFTLVSAPAFVTRNGYTSFVCITVTRP